MKDPLIRFARLALEVGRDTLPDYSHAKSPRRFTKPQLLACLMLRAHLIHVPADAVRSGPQSMPI